MRIGIISDIHGDINHLRQVIMLLDAHNVDSIICAGDLTHGDPSIDTDAVINTLRIRKIPCALGNHDEETLRDYQLVSEGHLELDAQLERLRPENLDYLSNVPRAHMFEVVGKWLYLMHATPWSNEVHLFSYSDRAMFREIIQQTASDFVVFGHTHEPMHAYIDGVRLFNPGSIYENRFENNRTCAILSVPDFDFSVYDVETGKALRVPYIT